MRRRPRAAVMTLFACAGVLSLSACSGLHQITPAPTPATPTPTPDVAAVRQAYLQAVGPVNTALGPLAAMTHTSPPATLAQVQAAAQTAAAALRTAAAQLAAGTWPSSMAPQVALVVKDLNTLAKDLASLTSAQPFTTDPFAADFRVYRHDETPISASLGMPGL